MQMVRSAIMHADMPKVVLEDAPILRSLIDGMFCSAFTETRGSDGMLGKSQTATRHHEDVALLPGTLTVHHVLAAATGAGLIGSSAFIGLVMQTARLLTIRPAVFVVGPAGAGKTSVLATVVRAMESAGRPVETTRLHVKAFSAAELYGSVVVAPMTSKSLANSEEGGKEWTDGVLSRVMRMQVCHVAAVFRFATHRSRCLSPLLAAQSNNLDTTVQRWSLLDGVVDPGWVESLNSVMDDNRVLTLASNERISLRDNMRVVVESLGLEHATPATVSRGAVVFVGDEVVSWQDRLEAWLQSRLNHGYEQVFAVFVSIASCPRVS